MGMDWRDKTVSMNHVKREEFDTALETVTVAENRIVVDPKDVEDWERILQDVSTDRLLEMVHWRDVADISMTTNELYYPHIDITLEGEEDEFGMRPEKRIYFREDEEETLEKCFKAIKKFWNAWRQRGAVIDERFDAEDAGDDEPVELADALRAQSDTRQSEESDVEQEAVREPVTETPAAAAEAGGEGGTDAEFVESRDTEDSDDSADDEDGEDAEDADEDDEEVDAVVEKFMEQD